MREEAEHQWQLALEAREEAGMTSAEFERCRASGSYAENANLLRAFWPDSFGELNFGHKDRLERSAARAEARLAKVRPGHRAFGLRLAESRELGRGEPHPGLVSPIDAASKA